MVDRALEAMVVVTSFLCSQNKQSHSRVHTVDLLDEEMSELRGKGVMG